MLIKKDKKVLSDLHKLYEQTNDRNYFFYFDNENDRIYLTNSDKTIIESCFIDYSHEHKQIGLSLEHLVKNGYIHTDTLNTRYFYLSNTGANYQEFEDEEVKQFLFRSILTPIFVSIITNFIIYYVMHIQ